MCVRESPVCGSVLMLACVRAALKMREFTFLYAYAQVLSTPHLHPLPSKRMRPCVYVCVQQYWDGRTPYDFKPVMYFAEGFAADEQGKRSMAMLDEPHHTGPKEAGLDPLVRQKCAPALCSLDCAIAARQHVGWDLGRFRMCGCKKIRKYGGV